MISKILKQLCVPVIVLAGFLNAHAQLRLPDNYFWKQLPNGLQVLVIENHKVPLATIEIAVKNGAYTEGPEYSGLSHLFEHMFFKANRDYPDQASFLKRTQELGAIWNGTTDVEKVNYFFTLGKDSLNAGMRFMNAAIRFPIYREEDMKKERPVVDGEFQRAESDPGFQVWYESQKKLWGDLITRKMAIGDHNIINTATPEKMMVIKDKYYVPNNSLLIICGDVQHDNAFTMAQDIFGSWPNSGFDPQAKYPIPPFKPLTKSESFIKEMSIAKTPYMQFSWQGPAYVTDSVSTLATDMFSTILALNSSKFQQALVNTGLATYAGLSYQTTHYVSSLEMFVVPNPNKLKECYEAVTSQINLFIQPGYFTDEQLANAKAIRLRDAARAKEKPSDLPHQASFNWTSTSLNYMTDEDNNYQKVTRADIERFINLYLNNKPMVSGIVISPDMAKSTNVSSYFAVK